MEQISYDEGSGGYHRPCSAAAALTSTFSAPGSAIATWQAGSISTDAHPVQRDGDAAVDGRRAAGQPGAGAARHDRDPVLGGPPHGLLHLRRRSRRGPPRSACRPTRPARSPRGTSRSRRRRSTTTPSGRSATSRASAVVECHRATWYQVRQSFGLERRSGSSGRVKREHRADHLLVAPRSASVEPGEPAAGRPTTSGSSPPDVDGGDQEDPVGADPLHVQTALTRTTSGCSRSASSARLRASGVTDSPVRKSMLRLIRNSATTPSSTPTAIDPIAS